MKIVYVPMSADLLHHGHLKAIEEARKLGEVIIGLLTDEAIASFKRAPLLSFEQRKTIAENIKGVKEVIPQKTKDYVPNLKKLKPDYLVHGEDWKYGASNEFREKAIEAMQEWNGQVIEIPLTGNISSSKLKESIRAIGTTPEIRLKRLKKLLQIKPLIRFLEAHNGLTGLIIENIKVEKEGEVREFDGTWISSLTDSVAKGKPDTGFVDLTSRLNTINQILEATTKPIILDGDNGGSAEHFSLMVKTLERLGVSAVIIEDKISLKKNSLFGIEVEQEQDNIENFSNKISSGKKAQITDDFMIIARIESLILKKGMEDALKRAKKYINAGADGIMIHSKEKEANEILEFCKKYNQFETKVPLIVVPTTYNKITERELQEVGANIVIYANHLLRSAYPAMKKTAETILHNKRSFEVDEYCMGIKEILNLIS